MKDMAQRHVCSNNMIVGTKKLPLKKYGNQYASMLFMQLVNKYFGKCESGKELLDVYEKL